jgi:hypothetical protein
MAPTMAIPLLLCSCLPTELSFHFVPLITPRRGLLYKHHFQQYLYRCVLNHCCGEVAQIVSVGTCFVCKARYPVIAVVYLLILWSLSSSSSTLFNIIMLVRSYLCAQLDIMPNLICYMDHKI